MSKEMIAVVCLFVLLIVHVIYCQVMFGAIVKSLFDVQGWLNRLNERTRKRG